MLSSLDVFGLNKNTLFEPIQSAYFMVLQLKLFLLDSTLVSDFVPIFFTKDLVHLIENLTLPWNSITPLISFPSRHLSSQVLYILHMFLSIIV